MTPSDLVIVGGGPAGLAAAIGAKKVGLTYRVFEKGALVNSLLHFPTNMVFFTTPELLELGGLPFVTPYEKPTRVEALRYYRRVVDSYEIEVEFGEEVVGVVREKVGSDGVDGFGVETRSAHGTRRVSQTRAVVLTTGCYDHPNLVGVPGEDLPHVSHYYTEPHAYYRKQVVVVGGKNSAAEAALDLYRAGAHVTLVHRRAQLGDSIKYWVRPDIENRIKEGTVAARFETSVVEIGPTEVVIEHNGARDTLPADAVFLLTGYRADKDLLTRAGVRIDPVTSAPDHDRETLETNVSGVFVAGAIVTGVHSGQIFIENGRFHGEIVVEQIRRRLEEHKRIVD